MYYGISAKRFVCWNINLVFFVFSVGIGKYDVDVDDDDALVTIYMIFNVCFGILYIFVYIAIETASASVSYISCIGERSFHD